MADPSGGVPHLRPKIFSISYSFQEILTKSYVGAPRGLDPLLQGILNLPLVSLGSKDLLENGAFFSHSQGSLLTSGGLAHEQLRPKISYNQPIYE